MLVGLAAAAAVPERPQLREVGVSDGLPSGGVTGLASDRDGYLWIATRDGLARYDGVGYRIFRHAPGDPAALPGNSITALHVDARNRVWVGVEGNGLSVLDADRRGFRHFTPASQPELQSGDVWAIAGTTDGAIWFGTFGGGLYRLGVEQRLRRFLPVTGDVRSLPAENVLALAVDARGVLWVGTSNGVASWNGRDFERLPASASSGAVIFSLSAEADGSLWIGSNHGLDRRHADGRIERGLWRGALTDPGVTAVLRDRAGTLWITTRRGLLHERDGVVAAVTDGAAATAFLLAALEDSEGGLWFASKDDGLLRLPAGWRRFSAIAREPARRSLRAAAAAADGGFWLVGKDGTLAHYDPASGTLGDVEAGRALHGRRLAAVLERGDGRLWIGGQEGLFLLDPRNGALRQWREGEGADPLLPGPVDLLAETGDGLLWLASYGGGVQARDADGHVVHELRPGGGNGLDSPDQEQLAAGPDGALWLANPKGLRRWNAAAGKLQAVPGAPAAPVFAFTFVPPDTLWLHRMHALEAYRWNGEALQRVRSVGPDQGLPALESGSLLADRSGALWLSTARGLLRYDPVAGRLRMFGVRDGLPSQEFDLRQPIVAGHGLGLASTHAGMVLFDPAHIRDSGRAPRVVFDALSVRRGEDLVVLPSAGQYVLEPGDRDLRVAVRMLSFSDPASHRYRFRLHGYDPDWVEVGTQGERVFSRLEPGRYWLEVRAATAEGLWSDPQSFRLSVRAPWWRGAWARAGAALALGGVLLAALGLYRRRLRRRHAASLREQRQRLLEEGSEAKSRFLATLGHEIRTPMTGVLGMAELLLGESLQPRQRDRVEAIQRSGRHLLRLVNDALDLARVEAGKLELRAQPFDLHALLAEVAAMLQPLAEGKGLVWSLQRAPDTPHWLCGDADRVRQILLNLGHNAIKFTERGEVALRSAALAPPGVRLEVSDSGPGLDAGQQARLFRRFEQADGTGNAMRHGGSGLGLAISQELAAAMGGRITVDSRPGRGTTFRVELPLPEADAVPSQIAEAAVAGARQRLHILVVEDDATVAAVVLGLLETLGHQGVHAAQALAALAELQASAFDLVLLDLDLPGLDGLELARLIRGQGRTLPLLALTARADAQAEPLARAAGMDGFLRKPVTSGLLADAIHNVLL